MNITFQISTLFFSQHVQWVLMKFSLLLQHICGLKLVSVSFCMTDIQRRELHIGCCSKKTTKKQNIAKQNSDACIPNFMNQFSLKLHIMKGI